MNGWNIILFIIGLMLVVYAYDIIRNTNYRFNEIYHDGHKYLIYYHRGICHHPDCECQNATNSGEKIDFRKVNNNER